MKYLISIISLALIVMFQSNAFALTIEDQNSQLLPKNSYNIEISDRDVSNFYNNVIMNRYPEQTVIINGMKLKLKGALKFLAPLKNKIKKTLSDTNSYKFLGATPMNIFKYNNSNETYMQIRMKFRYSERYYNQRANVWSYRIKYNYVQFITNMKTHKIIESKFLIAWQPAS